MPKKKKVASNTIALNRKARHDYTLSEHFEAGLVLQGWEVKSLREKRVQIRDSYVLLKGGEAFLLGMQVTPLPTAAKHLPLEPDRTRKLLLTQRELNTLFGAVERRGFALIPLSLYWKSAYIKLRIALARGKKRHDKRQAEKEQEWQRQRQRLLKQGSR